MSKRAGPRPHILDLVPEGTARDIVRAVMESEAEPLKVGDHVRKANGFRFPGVIVAVFETTAGARRVVVEAQHEDFAGMLHIYNPSQLERRQ